MDQSSGQSHMRDGVLNANMMSLRFSGKYGTYKHILDVCDEQSMLFSKEDEGPFYLDPEERRRQEYDSLTGKVKSTHKTKEQSLKELKEKGCLVRRHYSKEAIHKLAKNYQIELTHSKMR